MIEALNQYIFIFKSVLMHNDRNIFPLVIMPQICHFYWSTKIPKRSKFFTMKRMENRREIRPVFHGLNSMRPNTDGGFDGME
jgi:hypothetical protein